ncbi:uncharacterized protein DFL_008030 [Arthrobotrys flagrans]|uniref:Dynamin-type G domain-containing protein n=1 Tax=Arthrobotrys flagrans TaxID=97331 RepID=A0A436ZML8_ARTFL|nr:hypothetical protein DFL_008030 [Arthrobotrys flagrans]
MSTGRKSVSGGGLFDISPRRKVPSTPRSSVAKERTPPDTKSPASSDNSEGQGDESNDEEGFHESSSSISTPQLETEEFSSPEKTPINRNAESKVISLDGAIGTEEHRKLLDKIDKLRALGVNKILALPQLVVTGDQSSGKSSVLEALTGLPLPRSSGLCTRFATEICLRRSPYRKPVIITIKPAAGRRSISSEEQAEIDAFRKVIPEEELTTDRFLEILNQASDVMRVPRPGQRPAKIVPSQRAFSDHLLSFELSGPQHAQFSVIDLPGLIRSVANQQRRDDIDLIKRMNLKYIEDKRSIILAVLSANVDAANQEVLQLAKDIEETGRKTLGILTKPDRVEAGGEIEVIRTARNQTYRLGLGYFVVRNRGPSEMELSGEGRDSLERSFFTQEAPWNTLPKDRVGVKSLKEFLGKLIYEQIRNDIPQLQLEIEEHIEKIKESLTKIGNPRTSTLEQKLFVTEVEVKAREITDEAFHGRYEKKIFTECESLKLRQHARALNKEFSEAFIKYGNNRAFSSTLNSRANEEGEGGEYHSNGRFIPTPREDHEILQWIEHVEASSRGYELPSLMSAYIHSRLFQDITENWNPIAEYYFQQLRAIVTKFHNTIMDKTCSDEQVRQRLSSRHARRIGEIMETAAAELKAMIEAERTSILLTENPDFLQTVQSFRSGRLISILESVPEDDRPNKTPPPLTEIRNQVLRNVHTSINTNLPNSKIITIHDDLRAFYRIARRRIVDGIIVQVFERKVLRQVLDLYDSKWVIGISDEELNGLAGEPQTTTQERLDLTQDLQTFKEALFTLD